MTTDVTILQKSSGWKYWVAVVGGISSPLLSLVVARWLPFRIAVAVSFFLIWFLAGLIFARKTPPPFGLPAWVAALIIGTAVSIFGVVFSFFLSWN